MGMKLGKFSSNSSKVLETIQSEDVAPKKQDEDIDDGKKLISKQTKIIGTTWDPSEDVISFPYPELQDLKIPRTKRGISKLIPTIYDINGELAPYILRGKVILSDTWAYEKVNEHDDNINGKEDVQKDPDNPNNKLKVKKSTKLSWDELLPDHLTKAFEDWIKDIEVMSTFKTSRYMFGKVNKKFNDPPPR